MYLVLYICNYLVPKRNKWNERMRYFKVLLFKWNSGCCGGDAMVRNSGIGVKRTVLLISILSVFYVIRVQTEYDSEASYLFVKHKIG